jgi:hypothetical protein
LIFLDQPTDDLVIPDDLIPHLPCPAQRPPTPAPAQGANEPAMIAADNGASGKFTVRLPRSLHRKLAEQVRREGVSLNNLPRFSVSSSAWQFEQKVV